MPTRHRRPAVIGGTLRPTPGPENGPRIHHPHTAPTVWMATPDGLTAIDVIAVERVVTGRDRGLILTMDERRYAAHLMLAHLPYSVVARRLGVSAATLRDWFPHHAPPVKHRTTPAVRRAVCGTLRGYRSHRYQREPACRACKDAYAAADRHYRAHGTYPNATAPLAGAR